jgi:hypothetical protein
MLVGVCAIAVPEESIRQEMPPFLLSTYRSEWMTDRKADKKERIRKLLDNIRIAKKTARRVEQQQQVARFVAQLEATSFNMDAPTQPSQSRDWLI